MGVYIPWVFLIVGEAAFIVYDMFVTIIVTNYLVKVRKKLFKDKFI